MKTLVNTIANSNTNFNNFKKMDNLRLISQNGC